MLFNEQHHEIRRTVQRFVQEEINPFVEEWEQAGCFPAHELYKKAASLGLLGINKPAAYGGLALDYSYQAVFAEELGAAEHSSSPLGIGVQTTMATPALTNHGSDELKYEFLAPAIAGEMVACIGVSEPHAGSDVAQLKTTARKDGDDYIINGTKMWITNSTQADYICLLANTGDGPVHKNKSLIIVPTHLPGIRFSERLNKLGARASDTAQIFLMMFAFPSATALAKKDWGLSTRCSSFRKSVCGWH